MFTFGELLWRGLSVPMSAPVPEVSLLGKMVVRVAAGGFHCGAVSEQGHVYMWGENTAGQCGLTERGMVTNISGVFLLLIPPSFCVCVCVCVCVLLLSFLVHPPPSH